MDETTLARKLVNRMRTMKGGKTHLKEYLKELSQEINQNRERGAELTSMFNFVESTIEELDASFASSEPPEEARATA